MSSTSIPGALPSSPIFFIDAPEIEDFEAKFIYNFYTRDELINDKLNLSDYLRNLSFDLFTERVPRYVKLNWKPVSISNEVLSSTEQEGLLSQIRRNVNFSNIVQKITFEDDLSKNEFCSAKIGDFFLDEKLYFEMSSSVSIHGLDGDLATNGGKIRFLSSAKNVFQTEPEIIDLFSRLISRDDLTYGVLKIENQRYLNSQMDLQNEEKKDEYFEEINTLESSVCLGSRYGYNIVKNAINDPLIPCDADFSPLLNRLQLSRDRSNRSGRGTFNPRAYDATPNSPIILDDRPTSSRLRMTTVGYLISKIEILQDGAEKKHDSIFIENSNITQFLDKNVRYGTEYIYSIRNILFLQKPLSTNPGTNQWNTVGYFFSSKPSGGRIIKTKENIAPSPPMDFNIFWDYEKEKLTLTWNFPTNPQKDIKKFQIFRRESINHPFELISEQDFSDPNYPNLSTEVIAPKLKKNIEYPLNFFSDNDFLKSSSYIYTLCSIDAHGISSNYGIQYQVSFDKYKNEIIKKMISHSGAPKPYPNLYLPGKGMVDVARVNGHYSKRLFVYFSPQGHKLFDNNNQIMSELQTQKNNGHYEFNFINVDNLKNQILKINLKDLT